MGLRNGCDLEQGLSPFVQSSLDRLPAARLILSPSLPPWPFGSLAHATTGRNATPRREFRHHAARKTFAGWQGHERLERPLSLGIRGSRRIVAQVLLQAEGHAQLSLREGSDQPTLSRRACSAPVSQRRRALHCVQAL